MAGTLRIHLTEPDFRQLRIAASPDPMWEVVLSIHVLGSRAADVPSELRLWRRRAWKALHVERLLNRYQMLVELAPPTASYFPDFLTPVEGLQGLRPGLEALDATPPRRLARELEWRYQQEANPPGWVKRLGSGDTELLLSLATAYKELHRTLLKPDWAQVTATVAADRAERLLSQDGSATGLLHSLKPYFTWRDPVLLAPYPMDWDIHPRGKGVTFVPSFFCHGAPVAVADRNLPPTIIYPIDRGAVAGQWSWEPTAALCALLGRTRARILCALEAAPTTGEIAARLGIAAPTVSGHLTVLRNAGLVRSLRTGPSVQHTLTAKGLTLIDAGPAS
jgi:DNA-binding transcriptional ArsR family regulator